MEFVPDVDDGALRNVRHIRARGHVFDEPAVSSQKRNRKVGLSDLNWRSSHKSKTSYTYQKLL